MGIKLPRWTLKSGHWFGQWRLDVGQATLGECQLQTDFVIVLGDIWEKNSGAQARKGSAQTLYFFRAH